MNKLLKMALIIILSVSTVFAYASTSERLKSAGENLEGSTQEVIGDATDNPKLSAKGKINRAKGELRHTKEDAKDLVGLE